jgi:disulfide bond formation protein DsbB
MTELVNTLVDWGTLVGQLALVAYLALLAAGREPSVARALGRHGYIAAFAVAMTGVVLSLYYSEIAGWAPCDWCWYQRIALYPIAAMLALAVFRREERRVAPYAILFASVGLLMSVYHVYLQFGPPALQSVMDGCTVDGGLSCSETYHIGFGYISMATSALTAFLLVLVGLRLGRRADALNDNAGTTA